VGLDAFGDAYSDPARPLSDRGVETAENQALETLAEGGLVGVALAAGGLAALTLSWRRRRREADATRRARMAVGASTLFALLPPLVTGAPLHAPAIAAGAVLAWHAAAGEGGPPRAGGGYPRAPGAAGTEAA
jgi:hypothetical protein